MKLYEWPMIGWLALAPLAGCATPSQLAAPSPTVAPSRNAQANAPTQLAPALQQVSFATPEQAADCQLFRGMSELSVNALIDEVLARNPTLTQMVAAWQAASARYPQVISLDDPMFGGTIGPGSIGSRDVDFAYRLEVSQKYPWCGKRALRGASAQAEASAARHDVEDVRLQLIESARNAFYEYYLVDRALAVNHDALRLLKEFRDNAQTRYKTGLVPQQDVLQADVEIGRQQERQVILERMREVAMARINTLMNLPTSSPLPPPPKELKLAEPLPGVDVLQAQAVTQRPDLHALADRLSAEEAALELAYKEYKPDVEVMAGYDAFWQRPEEDLRPQVGVRMNLPVRQGRRQGAVAEAGARVAQRRAELDRQTNQVNLQVQEAHAQVRESERIVALYTQTILPAAESNVKAAQAAYVTGKIPFLSLVEAERNLIGLRDRYYEALADYFRRRASLERAVGGPL